jgi:acyl-CoA reductase-like NAD-dependent aldehyde dehydrogenase
MSEPTSPADSSPADCDRALEELASRATPFARMSPREKAGILRELIPTTHAVAGAWVDDACRAKGLETSSPLAGEEWLAGPFATVTNIRLLAQSLEDIAAGGRPRFAWKRRSRVDGRRELLVHPSTMKDGVLGSGMKAYVLFEEGVKTAEDAVAAQASFYQTKDPEGGVSLVLGAGNVASIPPMDALYKLFVDGRVVLLKMNPVNAYLGPHFERALEPLTRRGLLKTVYGGGELGGHLCAHALVGDIHITGSDRTHDLIVWGPPGPERDRRKAENDPVLKKPITSELGNVSPVIVAPYLYSKSELAFVAKNIATQVVNNGSFNCNAAKMLVLPKGWAQRDTFLKLLEGCLAEARPRRAYYPGARDRYDRLTSGHERVVKAGAEAEGALPFTMVLGLDASSTTEPLFTTEPFCGILSEVSVGSDDPVEFFAAATSFCNDRLWGTLSAGLVVHPTQEDDRTIGAAFEKAIAELRYGAIAVNHWPAFVYGLVVPPWGGHPSATLANVQSGIGWVHNTLMLGRVEKAIVRGPLTMSPKPPLFYDNKKMREIGEAVTSYAEAPSWGRAFGVVTKALRG